MLLIFRVKVLNDISSHGTWSNEISGSLFAILSLVVFTYSVESVPPVAS